MKNILVLSLMILTGCASSPYESKDVFSKASNVTSAAGFFVKSDVSLEDFNKTHGTAIGSTEQVLGGLDFAVATSVNLKIMERTLLGLTDVAGGTLNVFSLLKKMGAGTESKDRSLMLAWVPKSEVQSEDDVKLFFLRTLESALLNENMPLKVKNKLIQMPIQKSMTAFLVGDGCEEPILCTFIANGFNDIDEVAMPDFLGQGQSYIFEIERENSNQQLTFFCAMRRYSRPYSGQLKKEIMSDPEGFERCHRAINNAAIQFSKNMPEWFYMYRPASAVVGNTVTNVLNKGKTHFFIKPNS